MSKAYFSRKTDLEAVMLEKMSGYTHVLAAYAWMTSKRGIARLCEMESRVVLSDKYEPPRSFCDAGVSVGIVPSIGTNMMHHKFMVLGDKDGWREVITGSYNFTENARGNDENIITSKDEVTIAAYVDEFQKMLPKENMPSAWVAIRIGMQGLGGIFEVAAKTVYEISTMKPEPNTWAHDYCDTVMTGWALFRENIELAYFSGDSIEENPSSNNLESVLEDPARIYVSMLPIFGSISCLYWVAPEFGLDEIDELCVIMQKRYLPYFSSMLSYAPVRNEVSHETYSTLTVKGQDGWPEFHGPGPVWPKSIYQTDLRKPVLWSASKRSEGFRG